uniref:Band 7 domain-containing protein n=1 Tax=Fibrocapsa japonica TaxID=94617 RepID=A0A7S2V6Z9_9STRA|mmetsp:Transcript_5917/g.8953  ORF Transcript_5917/g.8953 Transcript_5917/m.8953 type:complete len:316 (+) Transcript_5917:45-992(+)|eukprot:CAMPEP_0113937598 /NCGR_PEP_ID=MMETSP1339-20121228/4189_1 /TAXON_ID=94617 /ORGANISM="Fibrocapsa japonica" /LENGTH=315 /DNA_ID=CAMNT_0000940429 /DNA_START=45 /DNA_END=992 /DNA_ORIENTATION=+ /assembly_acc=CAM_ASM_000762
MAADTTLMVGGGLCVCITIVAISLIATSLHKLESTEYGVEYDVYRKKLDDAAKSGGLFSGPPGFEFIKFPSTFITVDQDGTCVSSDGLRVNYAVTFQYQMIEEWIVPAIIKYRKFDKWAKIVEAAGSSAVQHTCSEFGITNFQNKRGIIQESMENNLRIKLEGSNSTASDSATDAGVYARAISLQLKDVKLPTDYLNAVASKQSAQEGILLAQNQRIQEVTKANTELLAANEEAQRITDTAFNEANVTVTQARLKAEEIAFAFQTEANIIVNVKQYLNLTTDGVLSYMANQLYAQAPNVKVSTAEPAKLSRKDEL